MKLVDERITGIEESDFIIENGVIIDLYSKDLALSFDGQDDWVNTFVRRNEIEDFTIIVTFKFTGNIDDDFSTIIGGWPSPSDFFIGKGSGNSDLWIQDDQTGEGTVVIPNTNAFDGSWHTIAYSREAGDFGSDSYSLGKIYLDGIPISEQSIRKSAYWPIDITIANNGDNHFAKIAVDEVSIWNKVLSSVEVAQSYLRILSNLDLDGNEEGLHAYYQFNEGNGDVLTDISNNGNDASIYGTEGSNN